MENATLRPFRVRDPQWLVERHDTLYTRDEGFDESLGRQMARILEEFITDHDPRYEQGWIAEYQGGRLGGFFSVRQDANSWNT